MTNIGESICQCEESDYFGELIDANDENNCHSALIKLGESWASAEEY
jgi:hypothetical protein